MLYLADTHIALWLIDDPSRIPEKAKGIMIDPAHHWYLSNASVWEVAIKHAKHPRSIRLDAKRFHDDCLLSGMRDLPLSLEHFYRTELLPVEGVHSDPFDRMLLAQAKCEDMILVTHDKNFAAYDDPHVMIV